MEKQKKDLLIAAVLVIVCVFFLWNNFFSKKKRNENKPASSSASAVSPGGVNIIQEIRQSEKRSAGEEALWSKEWGRDPFVFGDSSGAFQGLGDLSISGIVWDKTKPLAVINGEVHTVGDTVKGNTILEIRESSVIFSTAEGMFELPLFQTNQTKPAKK